MLIIYLGRPHSSTFISDTPGLITLQYSCMLYRKDAGERTGVQNAKASASCVTLCPKGNLIDCPLVDLVFLGSNPGVIGKKNMHIKNVLIYLTVYILKLAWKAKKWRPLQGLSGDRNVLKLAWKARKANRMKASQGLLGDRYL